MKTFNQYLIERPHQVGDKITFKFRGKKLKGTIVGINPRDFDELFVDTPKYANSLEIRTKDIIK